MSIKSSHIPIACFGLLVLLVIVGCSDSRTKDHPKQEPPQTTVVNLATDTYDEYIGRGSDPYTHMLTAGIESGTKGWLGNPHPIGRCDICQAEHTRIECIAAFKKDFLKAIESNEEFRKQVLSLRGKRLGCYCKPEECHGDVIREYIESQ
jgi:hypothetical protein